MRSSCGISRREAQSRAAAAAAAAATADEVQRVLVLAVSSREAGEVASCRSRSSSTSMAWGGGRGWRRRWRACRSAAAVAAGSAALAPLPSPPPPAPSKLLLPNDAAGASRRCHVAVATALAKLAHAATGENFASQARTILCSPAQRHPYCDTQCNDHGHGGHNRNKLPCKALTHLAAGTMQCLRLKG